MGKRLISCRKAWYTYLILLLSLTGCKIEVTTEFREDGSGRFDLIGSDDNTNPAYNFFDSLDECRDGFFGKVPWNTIEHNLGANGVKTCSYSYQFDTLEAAAAAYEGAELKLVALYQDADTLVFKAKDQESCADTPPIKQEWNIIFPGRIIEHNADRIVGNKLTWDSDSIGFKCYDIAFESDINAVRKEAEARKAEEELLRQEEEARKAEEERLRQEEEARKQKEAQLRKEAEARKVEEEQTKQKKDNKVVEDITIWTTILASLATVVGTAIAYKESRKKK